MKITRCLAGLMLAWSSLEASAQDVATTVTADDMPALKRNSLELRPLETIISSVPGVASAGLSYESYLGRGWAAFATGMYSDVKLSGRQRALAQDEVNEPVVRGGYGYTVGAGVRVYEDAIGDSWYGGGQLDYQEVDATWEYNDEELTSQRFAVIPGISGGYRWVWNGGFLIRAGVYAGLPSISSQSVGSAPAAISPVAATEGESKLEDLLDAQTIVNADLGLGWMF